MRLDKYYRYISFIFNWQSTKVDCVAFILKVYGAAKHRSDDGPPLQFTAHS